MVESVNNTFQMDVKLTKVNKSQLLLIDYPHYEEIKARYPHLKGVNVADTDVKEQLQIHVILSVGD